MKNIILLIIFLVCISEKGFSESDNYQEKLDNFFYELYENPEKHKTFYCKSETQIIGSSLILNKESKKAVLMYILAVGDKDPLLYYKIHDLIVETYEIRVAQSHKIFDEKTFDYRYRRTDEYEYLINRKTLKITNNDNGKVWWKLHSCKVEDNLNILSIMQKDEVKAIRNYQKELKY